LKDLHQDDEDEGAPAAGLQPVWQLINCENGQISWEPDGLRLYFSTRLTMRSSLAIFFVNNPNSLSTITCKIQYTVLIVVEVVFFWCCKAWRPLLSALKNTTIYSER
jgi:hypothetical protein